MCINGRKYLGNTPTIVSGRDTTMRFGVVGMGSDTHTFHLHRHRWTIPSPDGNDPSPSKLSTESPGVTVCPAVVVPLCIGLTLLRACTCSSRLADNTCEAMQLWSSTSNAVNLEQCAEVAAARLGRQRWPDWMAPVGPSCRPGGFCGRCQPRVEISSWQACSQRRQACAQTRQCSCIWACRSHSSAQDRQAVTQAWSVARVRLAS
jgi:Multicopper oxidase